MARKRVPDSADEDIAMARKGIKSVIEDADATAAEKLKAIEISLKLVMIEHKIKGTKDDGSESFFPQS